MFYSVWNPSGYYYLYENKTEHTIGNDLPIPRLPTPNNPIGIPAIECGRNLPANSRMVAKTDIPIGIIVNPKTNSALGALPSIGEISIISLTLLVLGAGTLYFIATSKR